MSNNGAVRNRHELAARMLEAALEIDRAKILLDGRRVDEHDIWKVCSKIVGDIRENRDYSIRVNAQTVYRFGPYLGLRGIAVAAMACGATYGKSIDDHDLRIAAEKVVADATGTAGVIHVSWECWIHEQGQWAAAAWDTLSNEQREAVRACIDALEIKAAVKTFQAITHVDLADDKIVDYAADYIKAREAEADLEFVTGRMKSVKYTPPLQNTPHKTSVRFKR